MKAQFKSNCKKFCINLNHINMIIYHNMINLRSSIYNFNSTLKSTTFHLDVDICYLYPPCVNQKEILLNKSMQDKSPI